jgi:Tfp pilus assembly protein FimT
MRTKFQHQAFTLVELLVVLAMIIVIGAVLFPTLLSVEGDRPIKAAGDIIRARLAEARVAAIEEGKVYRFAISPDGKRVRFAPDDANFLEQQDEDTANAENELPKSVVARVVNDDAGEATVDSNGWTRVATFQADGTCRETVVEIELTQPGTYSLIIRLRGLTGNTQIIKRKGVQ